jgi:AbrB family transcriptional regulator (stage V sporulation protein T)
VEWIPGQVEQVKSFCVAPIIVDGNPIGAVYLISKVHFIGDTETKAVETAAHFLAKQMEH